MSIDKNADNIQVMIRVRPFNSNEIKEGSCSCVTTSSNSKLITLDNKPELKKFNFDWVGGEATTQQEIFKQIGKPMVETCLEGYNCCIFAYGQTGAGKTFTMQGRGLEDDQEESVNRGLQPRVFDFIFSLVESQKRQNPNITFLISCSYLEIYNEVIQDLLEPMNKNLQIREDLKKGIYVDNLREEVVDNSAGAIHLLRIGGTNRHIAATNMNSESSRSHSVFSMTIESKKVENGAVNIRSSKFHFVDLAGSERQAKTGAQGDRLKEASNINKSLSVLGQVINSLVLISQGKQQHIRYRESKLTFLLKDSLGGNSKTCLIANISPASSSYQETYSTLLFAQTAKQIKNKASINEDASGDVESLKEMIRDLKDKLDKARKEIEQMKACGGGSARSPKGTPFLASLTMSSELERSLLENSRLVEIEMNLIQKLEIICENELLVKNELIIKQQYIETFQSAVEFYEASEFQYRSVISLNLSRIERLTQALNNENKIDIETALSLENIEMKQEIESLFEIVAGTPTIMGIFTENVRLRESIEKIKAGDDYSCSVVRELQENRLVFQELIARLEESIQEKKLLCEKLEGIPSNNGSSASSINKIKQEKQKELENLKAVHQGQMKLSEAKMNSQAQEISEYKRQFEAQVRKNNDLIRENDNLKETKKAEEEKNERRIKDLLKKFQEIQKEQVEAGELEKAIHLLKLENLKLQERNESLDERNQNIMREMEEYVGNLESEMNEKEEKFFEDLKLKNEEIGTLAQKNQVLEDQLYNSNHQVLESQEELNNLAMKLSEVYQRENEYKLALSELEQMNHELKENLELLDDQSKSQISHLENENLKQQEVVENLEVERKRIQDELDILNQTNNYHVNELEEKKILIQNLKQQATEQEKSNNELKKKLEDQKKHANLLEKQIYDQDKDDSPFKQALKQNSELLEELNHLKTELFGFEQDLERKIHELEKKESEIGNLHESVHHYTNAYQDAYHNLQNKVNELQETKIAYDSKVVEVNELEQKLQNSNEEILAQNKEIENLHFQLNDLAKEINLLNLKAKESQQLLKEKDQISFSLEGKIADLAQSLQEIYQENSQTKQQLQDSEQKLEEKQVQINDFIQEFENIAANYMELENTKLKQAEEIEVLNEKIRNLTFEKEKSKKAEIQEKLLEESKNRLDEALEKLSRLAEDGNEKDEALQVQLQKTTELEILVKCKDEKLEALEDELSRSRNEKKEIEFELKEKEKLMRKMNIQAATHFKQQEEDIKKIMQGYGELHQQHQFVMATASIKDNEAVKHKEEIRLVIVEKEMMKNEIQKLKESQLEYLEFKKETEEKIKKLNDERLALLVKVDSLESASLHQNGLKNNNQMFGLSSTSGLNKLKEENLRLRTEKVKLEDSLCSVNQKREQLQKKLDEMSKRRNLDPGKLGSEINQIQYLEVELEKLKEDNKLLYDASSKLNQMLHMSFYSHRPIHFSQNPESFQRTLEGVQELIQILQNKEHEIRKYQADIDTKKLHHDIKEREYSVLKQKYQLMLANDRLVQAAIDYSEASQNETTIQQEKKVSQSMTSTKKRPLNEIVPEILRKESDLGERRQKQGQQEMNSFGEAWDEQETQKVSPSSEGITNYDSDEEEIKKKIKTD